MPDWKDIAKMEQDSDEYELDKKQYEKCKEILKDEEIVAMLMKDELRPDYVPTKEF